MQPSKKCSMEDGDAKRLQVQVDRLTAEVGLVLREARFAITQAQIAHWCSTQLTHVIIDMLTRRDVVTKAEIRLHFESTLALMRPHRKQQGVCELAKELELLLSKVGSEPNSSASRPVQMN